MGEWRYTGQLCRHFDLFVRPFKAKKIMFITIVQGRYCVGFDIYILMCLVSLIRARNGLPRIGQDTVDDVNGRSCLGRGVDDVDDVDDADDVDGRSCLGGGVDGS